ncbi:MAG: DUF6252 family protein [Bacteroidota bacterium]
MKVLKNVSKFAALFLVLFVSSCVYEPVDGTVDTIPDSGVFKADFSGTTWTANQTETVVSGHFIEISAVNSKGETFGIMIEGAVVGTYAANINIVAYNPAGSEFGYWSVNDGNPSEDTGSVTITSINTEKKTISGTFHFKGYWSDSDNPKTPINFTNGVFTDLPYKKQEETADVFTAKVGGVAFVSTDIVPMVIGLGPTEFISIGAEDANKNSITVSVKSNLTAGTYPITGNIATDVVQAFYENVDGENKAISGSVTITSITADRVKGTFHFTTGGATPFAITEGSFDVEY